VWQTVSAEPGAAPAGLGPLGVAARADGVPCVAAALRWLTSESGLGATVLYVAVPAPHPALAPLLQAGFRIRGVETFCCSRADLFFDPHTYLAQAGPEGTSIF